MIQQMISFTSIEQIPHLKDGIETTAEISNIAEISKLGPRPLGCRPHSSSLATANLKLKKCHL